MRRDPGRVRRGDVRPLPGFVGLPRGRGRRVAIVTNSGGPSILAADRAEAVGLDVAEPGPAIRAKLASFLPPHAALKNPIDLTVEGTERGYRETLTALLAQDEVEAKAEIKTDSKPNLNLSLNLSFDAVVAINIAPPYLDSVPLARGICDAAAARQAGRRQLPARSRHRRRGRLSAGPRHPQFPHAERAVAVLARMAGYGRQMADGRWQTGN